MTLRDRNCWSYKPSRAQITAAAICASFLVAVVEQARLIRTLVGRYTNEDHAILWLAASDWQHLRPREPTFYGQPYGVNLESIPTAILNALGVPFGTALPTALVAMALLVWVLFAVAAARRGWWLASLTAAVAPIAISLDHWVVVGAIGTGVGRLLAAVAVAVVLARNQTPSTAGLGVALGGFAIAVDTAAIMVALPALVFGAFDWCKQRRFACAIALGCLAPLAWKLGGAWYDVKHPDHALHGSWPLDINLDALEDNYHYLDRLFRAHALELYRWGNLYLFANVGFLGLAVASRKPRAILTVLAYIGLLTLLAAQSKSKDGTVSLWFPQARMTLAAPAGLWFAGVVAMQNFFGSLFRMSGSSRRAIPAVATVLVLGLTASTSVTRALTWEPRIHAIETLALAKGIRLHDVDEIYATCAMASQAAKAAGTRIVIFPTDRNWNYACAALDRTLITSTPDYERRYWVLNSLAQKSSEHMIIWGYTNKECTTKRYRENLTRCAPVLDGRALRIDYPRQPALDVLRRLNFAIRPFGPGCHPSTKEGCEWWATRYKR